MHTHSANSLWFELLICRSRRWKPMRKYTHSFRMIFLKSLIFFKVVWIHSLIHSSDLKLTGCQDYQYYFLSGNKSVCFIIFKTFCRPKCILWNMMQFDLNCPQPYGLILAYTQPNNLFFFYDTKCISFNSLFVHKIHQYWTLINCNHINCV